MGQLQSRIARIMSEQIAIIGVGRMGLNMARRLKDRGFSIVAAYDTRPRFAASAAKELGCERARSAHQAASLGSVVITCVTDDEAMEQLYSPGPRSLLRKAEGKLFINTATVSPRTHLEIESWAIKAGALSLEACMAGSISQARQGALYLMCAGSQEAFHRAKPILEALGTTVRHFGQTGEAAKIKACVNMVMNVNTAALAEGLALGDALGVDLNTLRSVFSETGANSQVLKTDGEDMQKRDHTCFFSAEHARKDTAIALRLARQQRLNLPLAFTTKRQYDRMVALGLGELDKSGVAELVFRGRGSAKKR